MADDIQGALPTAPANLGSDAQASQAYTDALSKVAQSLDDRNKTNWFNIAAGFLKPTRTGGFGESLGNASEAYGQQLQAQQANAPQLAMMRAQLAGQQYQLNNAAKLRSAQDAFIKDPTDKQAISDIAQYDPKGMAGVIDLAKSAPRVRALLNAGSSQEGQDATPFDVLVGASDPMIAGQAKTLQRRFLNGEMDPDKADQLGQQMLSLYTTSEDRKLLHGALAGVTSELRQAQIDKLRQEQAAYMSPEQKIQFEKTIVPVQDNQRQAQQFLDTLDAAKSTIRSAPSGPIEGNWYSSVGKYTSPHDPKVIAQTSLDSLAPQLVQVMPKFSPRGTVYDEKLHTKAIGDIANPSMSTENRLAQVDRLQNTVQQRMAENQRILDQWNANKTVYTPSAPSLGGKGASTGSGGFKVIGVEPASGAQ